LLTVTRGKSGGVGEGKNLSGGYLNSEEETAQEEKREVESIPKKERIVSWGWGGKHSKKVKKQPAL